MREMQSMIARMRALWQVMRPDGARFTMFAELKLRSDGWHIDRRDVLLKMSAEELMAQSSFK